MAENSGKKSETDEILIKDQWMIRSCAVYEEEYSDCTSIKARFNQYFIHGKPTDCIQWKKDCDNCYKWTENKDVKAGNELVESEKSRRRERLGAHYGNTVWTRRKNPPENWNCPLPDYISRQYENSYLNIKSREMKGEIPKTTDPSDICIIM